MKTRYMYQLKANFDSDEDANYGLFKSRKDAENEMREMIEDRMTLKEAKRLFWIEKLKVQ